jgi:hypothetical protein
MKSLLTVILLMGLSACSTAKVRILPGETSNKVVSTDFESDDAEEAAIEKANEYCQKYNKRAVFLNSDNKSKYTGKMDEGTRNTVRKASHAAMVLGGPIGAGTRSGAAGGLLGSAGFIGHAMTNDRDYRAEWNFKCVK